MEQALTAKQFNREHKINDELAKKIYLSNRPKATNSIAGKPKVLVVEILKRFFTNPIVVISTIIFLTILLTAIIVTANPTYPPGKSIETTPHEYNYWNVGYADLQDAPPMFDPMTIVRNEIIRNNIDKFDNPNFPYKEYVKDLFVKGEDWRKISSDVYEINFYKYFYVRQLVGALEKAQNEQHLVIDNTLVEYLKQEVDTFKLKTYFGTTGAPASARDIWSTVWGGAFESIKISLFVVVIETVLGVAIGAYLGFHAGTWIDSIFMRIIDIFQAPPSIIWLLMFISFADKPNVWILIAGLLFVGWTYPVWSTRLFIITVKDAEYILASKSVGASVNRRIFRHALPAILGKIAMDFVRRIPQVIMTIASLSFLGFYNDADSYNIGKFLSDNVGGHAQNPWIIILPATILLLMSLSLQFVAIGLHDALDPKVIKLKK